jgi:hypothetical protein
MCPNNDTQDRRDVRTRIEETVGALKAFGPSFAKQGIQGWLEPLGFAESSLSSIVVAGEAVKRSGYDCYRIVYDTFHHYLGPDTEKTSRAFLLRLRPGSSTSRESRPRFQRRNAGTSSGFFFPPPIGREAGNRLPGWSPSAMQVTSLSNPFLPMCSG